MVEEKMQASDFDTHVRGPWLGSCHAVFLSNFFWTASKNSHETATDQNHCFFDWAMPINYIRGSRNKTRSVTSELENCPSGSFQAKLSRVNDSFL